MNTSRILGAALFLGTISMPVSAASMSNNCRVEVRCFQAANGVYATVKVDAIWGALIDADMHLRVNGEEVKLEPILTSTQQVITTQITQGPMTVTVCARVEGRNWINDEHFLPADTTDCTYWSLESPASPNRTSIPVARPRAGSPTAARLVR